MVAPNQTSNPSAPQPANQAPAPQPPAAPPPGSLAPVSDHDSALLTLFVRDHYEDIPSFAAAANLTIAQALHWANQPHIAAYLAAFIHHEARSHHRAGRDGLMAVMAKAPNPLELRRAATTLLRAVAQANQPPRQPRTPKATPHRGTGGSPVSGARPAVGQERSPTPADGAPANTHRLVSPGAHRSPHAAPSS